MKDLLSKEKDIIEYLEKQYKTTSTLKNKLCGIYKCYTLLNIESTLLKDKIESYNITQAIIEDKKNHEEKKPIEEADKVLDYFQNELDTMRETIKKDTDILNRWDTKAQLYTVLKIYLTYGMLRPSEIIDMKITDTDEGNDKINYINVVSKKIVINNHKNDRNGQKVIDITDNNLNCILWKGLNKYLITSQNGEVYKDSSAFTKLFSKTFNNYTPYDLRKCISSKAIHEGDPEKIKMLEKNQGHTLDTILSYYNIYSQYTSHIERLAMWKENRKFEPIY
jgi:integrase